MATTKEACTMMSLRTVRVANTSGHVIIIEANTPTLVPGPLVDTAAGLGCVPADAKLYEEHKKAQERFAKDELSKFERLVEACDRLITKNDMADFTPSGYPKCATLAAEAGLEPGYVTESFRSRVFEEWKVRNRLPAPKEAKKKGE